ncbi:MAG: cytochrome c biogenesis protein CcsA [Spirochaetales bacterium]|nr:cytochrome c biogenesis protein CcsA [Spirochaetales bacterium]
MNILFEQFFLILVILSVAFKTIPVLKVLYKWSLFLMLFSAIGWVGLRGIYLRHAPFANMYESLSFFGILYILKCLLFQKESPWWLYFPGVVMITLSLLLPWSYKIPGHIPAALQSIWIFIHVPAYFIGYVSLTLSAFYSVILQFKVNHERENKLRLLVHRELQISWVFCSTGLVIGGIWADISWGRFWSWDPKETLALITWLIMAAALHFKGKNRVKEILIIIGFFAMLYTYFGVTFFHSGLHSYT